MRSTLAASSTVRLRELERSLTLTMRASEPSEPETSPTSSTKSPTTTDFGPNSRAFIAVTTTPASVTQVVRPRSTVVTNAVMESECDGRSLVRLRVVREGRIRASDSSYSRGLIEPNYSRALGNQSGSYVL